ncbi:unnamed protein product [Camellia sinensis]
MLGKVSSSKFYSVFFFFWLILLMFIILQPITSARKLADNGQRKVEVHGSPTPTAHSAIGGGGSGGGGGHSSPTPVTKRPMLSYSALNRRSAVCKTTATYSSCLRGPNGSRRPNGSRLSPPH